MQTYRTLEDHVNLLTEKGYLDSNFKTPAQLGQWLLEFRTAIDLAKEQASLNDNEAAVFTMALYGKFNGGLDTVAFQLYYLYSLQYDELALMGIRAHINKGDVDYPHAKLKRTYQLDNADDLMPPMELYQRLTAFDAEENNLPLYARLQREYEKNRNRDNDPKPDPKQDPYYDSKDPYEYDPGAEINRYNEDKFPQFVKKPREEEFKPDNGIKLGVPKHIREQLLNSSPLKAPPPFPRLKPR